MAGAYVRPRTPLPLGVGLLAVLIGILGALFLVGGLILVLAVAFASGFSAPSQSFFGAGLLGAALLLIFGALLLVVASGLWHLEMWALVLSFLVLGIAWIVDVVQGAVLSIGALVLLALLGYLFLVRNHFR